jgi:hypothetical protein
MDVSVTITGWQHATESGDDLYRALDAEFRLDDALRGRSRLVHAAPGPGEMNAGAIETIVVTLLSGGAGAALVRAWTVWVRHRTSDLLVTVTRPDGTSVTLDAKRVKEPEQLVQELERLTDQE